MRAELISIQLANRTQGAFFKLLLVTFWKLLCNPPSHQLLHVTLSESCLCHYCLLCSARGGDSCSWYLHVCAWQGGENRAILFDINYCRWKLQCFYGSSGSGGTRHLWRLLPSFDKILAKLRIFKVIFAVLCDCTAVHFLQRLQGWPDPGFSSADPISTPCL